MQTNVYQIESEMEYKYQLAKKGKSVCPECGHKTFVLYVDANGEPLDDGVGKCDRANNCAYHKTPREYFAENPEQVEQHRNAKPIQRKTAKRPSYMDAGLFESTLTDYENNNFVRYLQHVFQYDETGKVVADLIGKYAIGTSKHWDGATVFHQIDAAGRVHASKIMLFDAMTGHRVKEPFNHITWAHSVLNVDGYNLQQCLFGEHLLKGNDAPVGIVESEKTAILCSALIPSVVWVAVGGCEGLSPERCKPLAGRKVLLYPDEGKFDEWKEKAKHSLKNCREVYISAVMERNAAKGSGDDVADLLTEIVDVAELTPETIQRKEIEMKELFVCFVKVL